MTALEKELFNEIEAYENKAFEDLSVNEALILIAVCAAKEASKRPEILDHISQRITALAEAEPLFAWSTDCIGPNINKYLNLLDSAGDDPARFVQAAAEALNTDQKRIALAWATRLIAPDGDLGADEMRLLDRYRSMLGIDATDTDEKRATRA
ncbi:MAG: hypothetical protein P8010_00545 [Desulfosarcinaceae bacterium]|jgi:hypothetical protein